MFYSYLMCLRNLIKRSSLNHKNRLQETGIYKQHTHIHAAYTYTIMIFRVYTDKNIQFI